VRFFPVLLRSLRKTEADKICFVFRGDMYQVI
jgi:hypothetical protein